MTILELFLLVLIVVQFTIAFLFVALVWIAILESCKLWPFAWPPRRWRLPTRWQ